MIKLLAETTKNYIVIGANGAIGASFCSTLKTIGLDVVELSHSPTFTQTQFNVLQDIPESIPLIKNKNNIVILCAGYSNIADCEKNPELSNQFNVVGLKNILSYLRSYDVVPVFLSSDNIFDGTRESYDEQDHPNPPNLYGKQKREIEIF